MRGINNLFLLGSLHAEPEVSTAKSGKSYTRFELDVRTVKRVNGVDEEAREIVPLVAFGKVGELITRYVQVGDALHVVARVQSSEYKTDRGMRRSVSIVTETVNLLPNGQQKGGSGE